MASLTNTKISDTYPLLLKIETNGVDGTLRSIEDGDGTTSALQISTGAINVNGTIGSTGAITQGSGVLTIKNATGDSNGLRIFQDTSDASKIYNHYNGTLQLGVGNTTALTIDSSENSTFAGTINATGNITTDGIFKVDTAPDSDVIQFDQGGRKSAIQTYFSSSSTGSKLILKVSNGNTDGTMIEALDVRPEMLDLPEGYQVRFGERGNLTHDSSNYNMTFNTNSLSNALVIAGTGNVGIGDTSPSTALSHFGSASRGLAISNQQPTISFTDTDVTKRAHIAFEGANRNFYISSPESDGIITFHTGGYNERIRIANDGNVGIGDTSPTSDSGYGTPVLSVKGSTFPALAIKNSTSGGEGIVSTGNAAGLQLAIAGNATASDNYIIFRTGNTNSNYNSTERMRITSDGKFGFGGITPAQKYEFRGDDHNDILRMYDSANSDNIWILRNEVHSGTSSGRLQLLKGDGDGVELNGHDGRQSFIIGSFSVGTTSNIDTGKFSVDDNRSGSFATYIRQDHSSGYGLALRGDGGAYVHWYTGGLNTGTIAESGGTVSYNPFTASHNATLPTNDDENGYPYGTLVETKSIFYSKDENGNDTERGILYDVQKTQSANSKKVLGAYANKNLSPSDGINPDLHTVYVLGDGHILCNNEGGNIKIGDGICTSSSEGIGMKATTNPSMVIGIAQENVSFSGNETKLVAVQYGLQQFTPWAD
jgi:hypothetical protein